MKYFIKTNMSDAHANVESEKYAWMRDYLINIGFDWEDCLPENKEDITLNQKARFRKLLSLNNMYIDDFNEEIKIYLNNEIIAHWEKPYYFLMTDTKEVNPKNKHYYKIEINCTG